MKHDPDAKSAIQQRDEAFTSSALNLGLITPAQAEECSALHAKLKDMGLATSIGEVFERKGYLATQQLVVVASTLGADSELAIPGYDILAKIAEGAWARSTRRASARWTASSRSRSCSPARPAMLPGANAFCARRMRWRASAIRMSSPESTSVKRPASVTSSWSSSMANLWDKRLQRGPLPWEESLVLMRQMALALAHAHQHGIVHRDVKPSNIMLLREGAAKLADLGLARSPNAGEVTSTQSGMVVGSPAYVSPEQALGDRSLDIVRLTMATNRT